MAVIKCRYTFPVCRRNGKRQYHNEFWFCDCNVGCEECEYTRPNDIKSQNCINPTCVHCEYVYGEFEKTVKNYEYHEGDLKVGRTVYHDNEIEYLKIDGRILRGDDDG